MASTLGHHLIKFEAAGLTLGATAAGHLDFFEACRRKRDVIDAPPWQLITEAKENMKAGRNLVMMNPEVMAQKDATMRLLPKCLACK